MMMMKWTQKVKKMNSGREAVENRRRLSMGYVEMSHPSSNWKIGIQKTPLNHTGKKTNVEQRANEKKATEWTTPAAIATNEFSHYFLSSCVVHRARCCFFCLFQAFFRSLSQSYSSLCCFNFISFRFHSVTLGACIEWKQWFIAFQPELKMVMRPNVETIHHDTKVAAKMKSAPTEKNEGKTQTRMRLILIIQQEMKWKREKKFACALVQSTEKSAHTHTLSLEMRNNDRMSEEAKKRKNSRVRYWKDVTTDRQ